MNQYEKEIPAILESQSGKRVNSVRFRNKRTLYYLTLSELIILDLDETLAKIIPKNKIKGHLNGLKHKNKAFKLHIKGQTNYVFFRPYVKEMLQSLINNGGELAVYSMGAKHYVQKVIEILDPERTIFSYVFDRTFAAHCSNGSLVKDLSIFG